MHIKTDNKLPAGAQRERYLQECRKLILSEVQSRLADYLHFLEEKLFALANKAENNTEQARYFEAHQLIKQQQKHLNKRFILHIDKAYKAFVAEQATVSRDFLKTLKEQDGLSLVDEDVLEESIALSSMSRKVETRNAEELYALNQRLTAIRGGKKITPHYSPVEPAVFAEAIQQAISPMNFDAKSRLVVLKLFDTRFMGWLVKCYEGLNKHLVKSGILSHLRYQIKKEANEDIETQAPAAAKNTTDQELDAIMAAADALQQQREYASFPIQQELLSAIQQIQRARPDHSQPVSAELSFSRNELIDSLSTIQQEHIARIDDPDAPILLFSNTSGQLQAKLFTGKNKQERQISHLDADLIEIVGLLFEYMLNEEDLPDSAKALLSYLHTPFLKLALLDKAFFSHPKHPARQLLNSLVDAGQRWLEPSSKHKDIVFRQMRDTVQRILNTMEINAALFSQLAFDFTAFMRKHERRVRISEDRARQAAKGEDKLREIRLQVNAQLDERTRGKRLPKPIIDLLYEPWANYLAFNLLRYGNNSDEMQAALKVVEEILWYIGTKQSWVGKKASTEMGLPLEQLIRKGFETVGYDTQKGEVLIKSLQLCQRLSVDGIKDPTLLPPVYEPNEHQTTATLSDEEKTIVARLVNLEFGTWFMFNDDNKAEQRLAKLAWYNAKTMHFMFVNKLGHQIAVRTAEELAGEIVAGKTRILDSDEGRPFIEKALERILHQMRNK